MNYHKGITIKFLVSVLVICMEYGFVFVSGDEVRCIHSEREALLRFRRDLIDEYGHLSSWGTENCCKWDGVECSNTTGHVTALQIHDVGGNISSALLELHHLIILDLSHNDFRGNRIPEFIGFMKTLRHLHLNSANFYGVVPPQLGNLTNLQTLDLSCNNISDEVPKWFWSNLSPSYLNLSHNQISGTIPSLPLFAQTDVSYNKFVGPIPLLNNITMIFQLSHNKFSGSISSLCTVSKLSFVVDVSNNQLSGELPNCWENMTELFCLNLADNSFSGEIPHSMGSLFDLITLHLRNNNLSGELPSTLKNCTNLQLIDIGGNKLTGNIPTWIGANYANMSYLLFNQNRFYGSIPPEICSLTQIQVLDFSRNNLSGKIPQCFNNFTTLLDKNPSTISLHFMIGNGMIGNGMINPVTNYVEYALVQWKGQEAEYREILNMLKLIDLSSNTLVGNIPETFSSLKGLISLNLSRNSLTGNINQDIGQIEVLEILDLSRNKLSGMIPMSMAQLHYLAVLDLSNNNFSGKIPSSTQLQNFEAHVYAGNNELCGNPLALCPRPPIITKQGEHMKEKDDGFMNLSIGISIVFGFIVGFWGVVGSLILKKSWRIAYFNFWDDVGDWLYVTTTMFFRKFRPS